MSELIFWGDGGTYGSFPTQEDGWPHAGDIMRFYRLKRGLSAGEAAKRYGVALELLQISKQKGRKARPITASWILNMEKENRVPTDIARRRLLADLFGIPYALFGLSSLEQIIFTPNTETFTHLASSPKIAQAKDIAEDVARYEKEVRLFWRLHYTSTATNLLSDVDKALAHLNVLESVSSGRLKERIQSLLNSYYHLADRITSDQGVHSSSYSYSNRSVQITTNMQEKTKLAYALYSRGYTSLVWGAFGNTDATGAFQWKIDRVYSAIKDFEQALPLAHPQLKGSIKLALSRAYGYTQQSQTDVYMALKLIDQAGQLVNVGSTESSYGEYVALNEGMYHLNSAMAFNSIGRHGRAMEELEYLDDLKGVRGIERDQTRRYAWIDIQYAQACVGCKEYDEATLRATDAFLTCKVIRSETNIAIIRDIYSQTQKSSYSSKREAKNLGLLLGGYSQH